jgi:alkylhydroperoxidase family enzyme
VQAHANDLRAEVAHDWPTLVDATGPAPTEPVLDDFVHEIVDRGQSARLAIPLVRLVAFTQRVTETPSTCTARDVADLRSVGWTDPAIHDAVQIIGYFNYINRVADALGVEPEPDIPVWGSTGSD